MDKHEALDVALGQIERQFGKGSVMKMNDRAAVSVGAVETLGGKPDEAFFVRCDRSTMTQNDLDNGRLVCLIGVAIIKPTLLTATSRTWSWVISVITVPAAVPVTALPVVPAVPAPGVVVPVDGVRSSTGALSVVCVV